METRDEKDVKTVAIARALAIFVLVLGIASVGLYALSRVGVNGHDPGFVVVVAAAALLSVAFLVRHRD